MSMLSTRHWPVDFALILSLLVVGSALYFTQISRLSTSDYHGDEGPWVLAGDYYFGAYALERDWSYDRWIEPRYGPWSADTPGVGKYLIGGALWLTGPTPRDTTPQPPYNYDESFEWNLANGTTPPPAVIVAARRGIALTALLAAVALYLLARRLTASRAIGWVAGLLFLLDPLSMFTGQRVLVDMPALLFSLLALWAGHHWLEAIHRGRGRAMLGWSGLTGVMLALAVSTKLNTLYVAVTLAVWLVVGWGWRPRNQRASVRPLLASVALAVGITLALGLLLNPSLQQETGQNLSRLVAHGRAVATYDVPAPFRLETTQERVSNLIITGLVETGTYFRLSDPTGWTCGQPLACLPKPAILGRPLPEGWLASRPWLDALVALAGGLVVIARVAWPAAPVADRRNALFVLLWAGVAAASIVALIPFAWERWYLPMEPVWALLQAIALVAPFQLLVRIGNRSERPPDPVGHPISPPQG